jgi:hypothetical protein
MVRHNEVAQAWANGQKLTGSRMYTDGKTVWSYGSHWPIATWVNDDTILFNMSSYGSSSTSGHTSKVWNKLPKVRVIKTDTKTILRHLNYPSDVIVVENIVDPEELHQLLEIMKTFFKSKGVKRYPKKKIEEQFTQMIVANNV